MTRLSADTGLVSGRSAAAVHVVQDRLRRGRDPREVHERRTTGAEVQEVRVSGDLRVLSRSAPTWWYLPVGVFIKIYTPRLGCSCRPASSSRSAPTWWFSPVSVFNQNCPDLVGLAGQRHHQDLRLDFLPVGVVIEICAAI